MSPEADVDLEQSRGTDNIGELRLQILGPLRIWRGAVELDAGPAQQAVLLAVLLARAGRPVSTDELSRAMWGDEPPPSALNTIQKYVGSLRRLFEPGLPARETGSFLQRRGDAYVCTAGRDVLDLIEFRSLVDAARRAQAEQRNEQALDQYLSAFALWSGPAGAGLARGSNSTPVFVTLNAEFLDACAVAADLALSLGGPERALPSLHAAVAMDPYHEPLHARLISALGAAGQQAEALSVFRMMRRRLADELGLSPGEALVAAERAVLTSSSNTSARSAQAVQGPSVDQRDDGLVGRADELSLLWATASAALDGGSGVAVLEGEPGIGKTRLLDTVRAAAERHGILVVRGQCTESEGTPALWPWVEIVSALLDVVTPEEQASWRTGGLRELIEPETGMLTTSAVLDVGARFRLFERVVALVRATSLRRPVLVVMDDVHWADVATLLMFEHLAARMPPSVAMMGAVRDRAPVARPELATMLGGVSRLPTHRRVRLTALSANEVGQLVQIETGSAISPPVARGLHDRTAGNPFFVLELARLVGADGDLRHLTTSAAVPSTVVDVVRDRMARLEEQTKHMLQVAAVIGTELDIRILALSSGLDEQTCLDRFQEVEELGVLTASPSNPRLFRFSHDIVRESIVATTPRARLPRMHLDVADALDGTNAGDDVAVERVAYHLWSAGPLADPARTATALLRAGRMATAKCAYEAAVRHLQSAAQVARGAGLPQIELTALEQLDGTVELSSGGYIDSAPDSLERAERLARDLGRDRVAAGVLLSRYMAHAQRNQIDRAGRLARKLLDHGEASSDPAVRAIGWFGWGTHQRYVGNIAESQQYLARAANDMVPDDEPDSDGWQGLSDVRTACQRWLACMTAVHGDVPAARSMLDGVDAAAGDDPLLIGLWAIFSVMTAAFAGDTRWAEHASERGLSVDRDGSNFFGNQQRLGRCWATAMSGNGPAENAAEAAVIVASMEDPPRPDLPTWYCLLAEMWLAADELIEAERVLDKADAYLAANGQRFLEGLLMLLRAQLMRARGESAEVVRVAAERARAFSAERGAHLFARRAEEFLAL